MNQEKTTSPPSAARQRIVETADRLFYAEGVRAVGIDRIIAEAKVAKMTLYHHFASKDDLILAVLQFREKKVMEMFEAGIDRRVKRGSSGLDAFFATLKTWFKSEGFRGCSFINTRAEFADSEHPAAQFSADHKRRLHVMISDLAVQSAGKNARPQAAAISLLVEGAIVTAVMQQSPKSAEVARQAALKLLDQKNFSKSR